MVGWICNCRCTTCWPARPIPCPTSCAPSCPRVGKNRPGATSPAGRRVPMVKTLDNTTAPKRLRCALSPPWPWHWACLVAWTSGASMAPPPCLGHHDPPAWADARRSLSPPPPARGRVGRDGCLGVGWVWRHRACKRGRAVPPSRPGARRRARAPHSRGGCQARATVPRPPPRRAWLPPGAVRPSAPSGVRGRTPGAGAQARGARARPPYCHSAGSVSGLVRRTLQSCPASTVIVGRVSSARPRRCCVAWFAVPPTPLATWPSGPA